jgi:predicted transcriptional regulator of viral defense system
MNEIQRMDEIGALALAQGGCLTVADLVTALAEERQSSLQSLLRPLLQAGKLQRVKRGLYIWDGADARSVVARICPDATLSFGTVLAAHLLIGIVPQRHFQFTGSCRDQSILCPDWKASLHRLAPHLQFGWTADAQGLRTADPEKAVLDCLFYHQKGFPFSFDLETDIDRAGLSRDRFVEYVRHYPNPRFRSRCMRWLDAV